MLISVKRSNFILIIFKVTCHANPGADRNLKDQVQIF